MTRTFDEQLENYGVSAEGRLATSRPAKWISFAAAGAAASVAGQANAAIQPIDAGSVGVLWSFGAAPSTLNNSSFYLDFDANGNVDLFVQGIFNRFATFSQGVANFVALTFLAPSAIGVQGIVASGSPISFTVGSSAVANIYSDPGGGSSNLNPAGMIASGTGILGFQFNAGPGNPVNAWIRIDIDAVPGQFGTGRLQPRRLEILEGAYQDDGSAILAGDTGSAPAIPEPSDYAIGSLALLALGAAGVSHYRKKKAELATA